MNRRMDERKEAKKRHSLFHPDWRRDLLSGNPRPDNFSRPITAFRHAAPYGYQDSYEYADADPDLNGYGDVDTHRYPNSDADADVDTDTNAYLYTDHYAYPDLVTDPITVPNGDADPNSDTHTNLHAAGSCKSGRFDAQSCPVHAVGNRWVQVGVYGDVHRAERDFRHH